MKNFYLLLFTILLFTSAVLEAQVAIDSNEISSDIPALSEFHDIIFPIWHNAYPSKDLNALKEFVPGIKARMEALKSVTLPGILREREAAWKSQLAKLNDAAELYYSAAGSSDDQALLDAAEKLHYNYEMLVRAIRPALKSLDEYHKGLYVIYHKLLPDQKYNEMLVIVDTMVNNAIEIQSFPREKLSRRLGNRIPAFDNASANLYTKTVMLKEALLGKELNSKDEAVKQVHNAYQQLDALFQ